VKVCYRPAGNTEKDEARISAQALDEIVKRLDITEQLRKGRITRRNG
jgi:hypothetical protein